MGSDWLVCFTMRSSSYPHPVSLLVRIPKRLGWDGRAASLRAPNHWFCVGVTVTSIAILTAQVLEGASAQSTYWGLANLLFGGSTAPGAKRGWGRFRWRSSLPSSTSLPTSPPSNATEVQQVRGREQSSTPKRVSPCRD